MTDPWKGVHEAERLRKEMRKAAIELFKQSYDPNEFCRHLKVGNKSGSIFESDGITCGAMGSGAYCKIEQLSPEDALTNCKGPCSNCPCFESLKDYNERIEEEQNRTRFELQRQSELNHAYEYDFDIDNPYHRNRAEEELENMTDEELHELYDIVLQGDEEHVHRRWKYQITLLEQYPIMHQQNKLLNALRHTNEYSKRINYIKYTEMKNYKGKLKAEFKPEIHIN